VTSIDVGIGGGPGRQPVALVTNTIVSFRPRTSTKPGRASISGPGPSTDNTN
jgi:hypothetical protein